jgi:hypothetical protein
VLGRILAICLGLMTACYSPPQPDCGFLCGAGGACPADYHCAADSFCHRDSSPMSTVCAVDARPDTPKPIDAMPADADRTPPQVYQTSPAMDATGVPTTTVIEVLFSEPVMGVTTSTFLVTQSSISIAGTVTMNGSSYDYYFTPSAALPASTQIDVQLTAGIYDTSFNPLIAYAFTFTTAP